jgi:large conductance mechanosensitive channel
MNEFIKFIRSQGIIGLAMGFIMGSAVGKVVSSLVQDMIQPAIGLIFGSPEGLRYLKFHSIAYGNFLASLIDFLIIAAVVFLLFKCFRLEKLDGKK